MNPANGLSPPVSATDRSTRMIIDGCTSYATTPSHTPPDQPHKLEEPNPLTHQHQNHLQQQNHDHTQDVENEIESGVSSTASEFAPLSEPAIPASSEQVNGGGEKDNEPPGPGFLRRKSSDFYNRAMIKDFIHQHPHHHLLHHHQHHHGCWCGDEEVIKETENQNERGVETDHPPPSEAAPTQPTEKEEEFEKFGLGRRWSWSYEDAKQRMQMEWMKRSEAHQDQ